MKALLIIDMQQVSFTEQTPRFDSENVISRINRLSQHFRDSGDMVILIQHDGQLQGFCSPGTEEWQILDRIIVDPQDIIVSKSANDAFYRSQLQHILEEHNIRELVITGCASDFCVDATVKSALIRDYEITVIADGHTTADRPHLPASQVIAHYNWIWNELTPTRGRIDVVTSERFLEAM